MPDCTCHKVHGGEIADYDPTCPIKAHRETAMKIAAARDNSREKGGILSERPTEVASGLAIAAAVYGFLTQSGVKPQVAALIAVALAFGPLVISNTVDRIRAGRPDA
jgi:hypothetical protein